jgi:hypothetical protein
MSTTDDAITVWQPMTAEAGVATGTNDGVGVLQASGQITA